MGYIGDPSHYVNIIIIIIIIEVWVLNVKLRRAWFLLNPDDAGSATVFK
jgi:hypothetical protein